MNRPIENLVFDRTESDVSQRNNKGTYNVSDLNRVEKWCDYLSKLLYSYGYNINVKTKQWTRTDLPKISDIKRIRRNVQNIKNIYFSYITTPDLSITKRTMNIKDANDIEKILFDIDKICGFSSSVYIRGGVARCGQNRIIQQYFRRY